MCTYQAGSQLGLHGVREKEKRGDKEKEERERKRRERGLAGN